MSTNTTAAVSDNRDTLIIVLAGSVVLALAFGVRVVFGGIVQPLSSDLFDGRIEVFSLSIAIQNLIWGLAHSVRRECHPGKSPSRVVQKPGARQACKILGCCRTTRRAGSAGPRSFSRDRPARLGAWLTVAGDIPSSWAICLPFQRWKPSGRPPGMGAKTSLGLDYSEIG